MTIDEIYNDFCKSMSEIIVLQRNTKSVMQKQIQDLHEYKENFQDSGHLNLPICINNMFFVDHRTGKRIFFAHKEIYGDEFLNFMQLKYNRDYQFYLASAYEKFEDAIELIYAYLGKNDINFWPLSEFGKKRYDDIKSLDFDFYVNQAKNKKGGAIQIFKMLMEKFNCDIKITHTNLKTEIILIEKLRHIIIHNSGYTTNKDEFINAVAKDAGIFNNGEIDVDTYKHIEYIFGKGKYDKLVMLLDRIPHLPNGIQLPFTINLFEGLIQSIMLAVYIICEKSKYHIAEKSSSNNSGDAKR